MSDVKRNQHMKERREMVEANRKKNQCPRGVELLIEAMRETWLMDSRELLSSIERLKQLRRYCDVDAELVDAYISILERRRQHRNNEEAREAVNMRSDFLNICPKCETQYGPCDCS